MYTRFRNIPLILVIACVCIACGGSSGSSGVIQGTSNNSQGGQPQTDDILIASCKSSLNEIESTSSSTDSIVIRDLGDGCDYSLTGSVLFVGQVLFEPGVTVGLSSGASLHLSGDNTILEGTADKPIRFLAQNDNSPWKSIVISGDGSKIKHNLFSNGGEDSDFEAMAEIESEGLVIENTQFIQSRTSGLHLRASSFSTGTLPQFSNNYFGANEGYPLIVSEDLLISLDSQSNYSPSDSPNSENAVLLTGSGDLTGVIRNIGIPIRIRDVFSSRGVTLRSLVIQPGAIIEFPENANVTLTDIAAEGSAAEPIILRGWPESTGPWDGVKLSGEITLSHVTITDGGASTGELGAAVFIDQASSVLLDEFRLSNLKIIGSGGYGLHCSEVRESRRDGNYVTLERISFESSLLGDINPTCDLTEHSDGTTEELIERHNIDSCANVLLPDSDVPAVLTNSNSTCDYYLIGSIEASALAVQPGTTIYFARNADLSVSSLTALGNAENQITFAGEMIEAGSWDGLFVSSEARMDFVSITDGGDIERAGLSIGRESTFVNGADTLAISNTSISRSAGIGMLVNGDETVVEKFTSNAFVNNGLVGLSIPLEMSPTLDEASAYDDPVLKNGLSGIALSQQLSRGGIAELSPRFGVPWRFSSYRNSGTTNPGAMIVQPGTEIIVEPDGYLGFGPEVTMIGTQEAPISIKGSSEDPTNWGGIPVATGGFSAQYVEIEGGGATDIGSLNNGRGTFFILGTGSPLTLSNVSIRNSQDWAISCVRSRPDNLVLSDVTFENNSLGDVQPSCL